MFSFRILLASLFVLMTACSQINGGAPSAAGAQGGLGQLPPGTSPTQGTKKRVFITSTYYSGNIGGLAGADSQCEARAQAGGLGGVWIAWLSTSTTSAISRVNDVSPWYLVDNATLIFPTKASITSSGPASAINMTELGGTFPVANTWTATGISGTLSSGNDCDDWTTATSTTTGDVGEVSTGNTWTQNGSLACNLGSSLYCIEQ